MKNNNLVLVTGLFDIGRGHLESGFNRSFEHYLESFSKLLKVDHQLVIYVPPELNDWVWQRRSHENTRIINKTLDDLRAFPFYQKVQEIRTRQDWINQSAWIVDSTQAKLDLYNPLVMSKFFFLNDASLMNHFDAKHFLWVDAGLANTIGSPEYYFDKEFEKKVTPHLNKMMFVAFPYDINAPEVHGFSKHKLNELAGANTEFVCRGGLFGGNKLSINEMNDIYYQLLSSTLNSNFMGTEESIFTIMAYRHKEKCNVNMIDSNGLIVKYLEELKNTNVAEIPTDPLAFYFLVFNTPKQFEETLKTWRDNYPEFMSYKKYVVNNSNDLSVDEHYKRIFKEYNMEEFKLDNVGICGGRQFVAEHFATTDHLYYVFFEEDMGCYPFREICQTGFTTHQTNLFDKAIEILKDEKLDCLRLTFSEFFGTCEVSWAYINMPQEKKDLYYPAKPGFIEGKTYAPNVRNKTKIEYMGVYRGLPYAVGGFHISNWPILFSKEGNKKMYLEIKWAHQYEQTWMSHAGNLYEEGKLKIGCLLASPIKHRRDYHYEGSKRRENEHYTN
jgi:hypothetical protein